MKWRALNDYAAVSDCGRYTVCVVNVPIDGGVTRTYEAWYLPSTSSTGWIDLALRLSTAKEAQQTCESHQSQLNRGQAA